MGSLPRRQRVAAYAVVLREHQGHTEVLLSRLAPRISRNELWTLPGGGLEHGEDPRQGLVREIHEEAGLAATVGDNAHVYSAHLPRSSRDGELVDFHALRIVYDAWVPADAPEPRVVEVGGSTVDVAWHRQHGKTQAAALRRHVGEGPSSGDGCRSTPRPRPVPTPATGCLCDGASRRTGVVDSIGAGHSAPGGVDIARWWGRPRRTPR